MIKFTKMHGIGNDYIYINLFDQKVARPSELAREMSQRHYGVGADGLILIMPSDTADFRMRIFNADGSEAEMCGNGIRCFAKYVYEHGLTEKKELSIETLAGIMKLNLHVRNKQVKTVDVDMGEPILQRERIPMEGDPGMVINEDLLLDDGVRFQITALSMGNPHAIIFVEDTENFPLEKYGPMIETHISFPRKTNVEIVRVINREEVQQRTWERGTGETMACGTGASAVTVASILNKLTERAVTVHLRGGDLKIEWNEEDNHVYLSGPAVEVFEGTWISG
jgi:diaminopimelate epimerase